MSFRVFDCATTMVRYSNMAIIAIDVHLASTKDRQMNLRATTHIHTAIGRRRHDNIKALASRNKRNGGTKVMQTLQANEHLTGIAIAIALVLTVDVVGKVPIEEIHAQSPTESDRIGNEIHTVRIKGQIHQLALVGTFVPLLLVLVTKTKGHGNTLERQQIIYHRSHAVLIRHVRKRQNRRNHSCGHGGSCGYCA